MSKGERQLSERQLSWALRSRHAQPPRAFALTCVYSAAAVMLACSSDFPNEPDRAVTLEAVAWPTELHVTDVDTIEIQVRFRDSPQEITGLRLSWESSNDDVLRVVQLKPVQGGNREDTLVAQRRAVVTGRSGGFDTVRVVVEAGGGFEPEESTFVIQVTQKWVEVSAGKAHTCGRTVDSLVFCWGQGPGNGRPFQDTTPAPVLGLGDLKFVAVSAGELSSCGIIREHVGYCWGSDADGRLGNGDPSERTQLLPSLINSPTFRSLVVGRVACGVGENLIAYCWGANSDYQLGQSSSQTLDPCLSNSIDGCSLSPIQVWTLDTTPATYRRVSVGGHHVCGISQQPDSLLAFCWGKGPAGALGNSSVTLSRTPVPVTGGLRFLVIAAGGDHTCGIATTRATYCWGLNSSGQLGNGGVNNVMTPGVITPGAFDSITAGGQHTCALTSDGKAYCWGLGLSGQLGDSSTAAMQPTPMAVSGGLRFKVLSAGESHTCGVTHDGSLYCWGLGASGQLGTGDLANRTTPMRVSEP